MREIKFRAWDGERLRNVNTIGWTNGELDWLDTPKYHGPIDEDIKIMQYTGLKDNNGVEIYEGDILKINSPEGVFLGKVVHEIATYGIAAVKGQIIDYFPDNWNDDYLTLLDIYWNNNDDDEMVNSVEVIGNIYENPELLEATR